MIDPTDLERQGSVEHAPDGLTDPSGYQRYLLGLVGDDDPAVVQAATAAAWRTILSADVDLLRAKPAPQEWSAIECLGHAVDAEIVMAGRYRWAARRGSTRDAGLRPGPLGRRARASRGRSAGAALTVRGAPQREPRSLAGDVGGGS